MPILMGVLTVLVAQAPAASGCTKDTDCKGDRICEEGRCVNPRAPEPAPTAPEQPQPPPTPPPVISSEPTQPESSPARRTPHRPEPAEATLPPPPQLEPHRVSQPPPPTAAVEKAEEAEPSPSHHGSVSIDTIGVLLFGPTLTLEGGMGQWSFGASVRWFNFGLLAQYGSVLADTYLQFSWGAATFGRFYFGKNLNGAHLGIVAELLSVCVEDPVNLVRITRYSLAPEFEAGYRFAWSRVFVDIGGVIGPTIPLYWRSDVLPGNRRGPGSGEFYLGFFWAAKAQFGVFF